MDFLGLKHALRVGKLDLPLGFQGLASIVLHTGGGVSGLILAIHTHLQTGQSLADTTQFMG